MNKVPDDYIFFRQPDYDEDRGLTTLSRYGINSIQELKTIAQTKEIIPGQHAWGEVYSDGRKGIHNDGEYRFRDSSYMHIKHDLYLYTCPGILDIDDLTNCNLFIGPSYGGLKLRRKCLSDERKKHV